MFFRFDIVFFKYFYFFESTFQFYAIIESIRGDELNDEKILKIFTTLIILFILSFGTAYFTNTKL